MDPLVFYPALEFAALDSVNREHGRNIERMLVLKRLAAGEALIMVTSLTALCQKVVPPEALGSSLRPEQGRCHVREDLVSQLINLGYRREAGWWRSPANSACAAVSWTSPPQRRPPGPPGVRLATTSSSSGPSTLSARNPSSRRTRWMSCPSTS